MGGQFISLAAHTTDGLKIHPSELTDEGVNKIDLAIGLANQSRRASGKTRPASAGSSRVLPQFDGNNVEGLTSARCPALPRIVEYIFGLSLRDHWFGMAISIARFKIGGWLRGK